MKKNRFLWLLLATPLITSGCAQKPTGEEEQVNRIAASMTLEQKAKLVVGMGMRFSMPGNTKKEEKGNAPVIGQTLDLVPGAAGTTFSVDSLGITPMVLADGPAGLRIQPIRKDDPATYYCTAFPVATVLASTWDTALVQKVGEAMGNEVREYGVDILLAPALNIHRNPLCGRNFEYYSEDPLVAGEITAAMVKGVQSQGVGTSIKHFAANNQETNRNTVNTIASERAIREIYLEGFRIAVEKAQPWTVMSSYNKINGTYTSHSHDLLTTILRDEWGFKGFVMTDWFGGKDPVAQMIAGNDLLMPGLPPQTEQILKAVKEGKLDEKVLDQNVKRILTIMLKSPRFNKYAFSNKPDLKAHAEVTRQVATDGMVLLKNEGNALPLTNNVKNIAAFGNTSYKIIKGGTGSGNVNAAYSISMIEGLQNAGYTVDKGLEKTYTQYMEAERAKQPKSSNPFEAMLGMMRPIPEMEVTPALAAKMAGSTDVALVVIGRNSGEGKDREVEGDFNLTDKEKNLIRNVSEAFQAKGKKAIVILNIGGVIETASWRNLPDAILLAWQPGQEAGNSIADVVSGKVNPSGKLATTFPVNYSDVPSSKTFPGIELPDTANESTDMPFLRARPAEVVYEEDIYVGYRYYNTFNVPTAYEFGYGLSYTQFDFSNLTLNAKEFKDRVEVSVDIKNVGNVAGREVVQLYLGAPSVKLPKPSMELKGFAKTKLLQPGEVQTVKFTIGPRKLASYDTASSAWVAEAGEYTVSIGASSKDIRLEGSFSLAGDMVVEKAHKALSPSRNINVIKP